MTKLEREFLETIETLRSRTLMSLKIQVSKISGLVDELSRKIELQGTNAHYSVNSDIKRAGDLIWSNEMRLSELKKIEDDFILIAKKKAKDKKELINKKKLLQTENN
jgi:hypothetical protein